MTSFKSKNSHLGGLWKTYRLNLSWSELDSLKAAMTSVINDLEKCHDMLNAELDLFLGVPFNIASYALLTHMVAQICGLEVGEFIWTGGDCHIYQNHREQVELQLTRSLYTLPTLVLNPDIDDIFAFTYEDISVEGYESHPAIKAKVAV